MFGLCSCSFNHTTTKSNKTYCYQNVSVAKRFSLNFPRYSFACFKQTSSETSLLIKIHGVSIISISNYIAFNWKLVEGKWWSSQRNTLPECALLCVFFFLFSVNLVSISIHGTCSFQVIHALQTLDKFNFHIWILEYLCN